MAKLKKSRTVNLDDTDNRQNQEVDIPEEGRVAHIKGFGFVRVFRTDSTDGDAEESEGKNVQYRAIETYHRRLKQYCGAEQSQC